MSNRRRRGRRRSRSRPRERLRHLSPIECSKPKPKSQRQILDMIRNALASPEDFCFREHQNHLLLIVPILDDFDGEWQGPLRC